MATASKKTRGDADALGVPDALDLTVRRRAQIEKPGSAGLDHLAAMMIRDRGDHALRCQALTVAERLAWNAPRRAEHVAAVRLQADVLVTGAEVVPVEQLEEVT